MGPQRGRHKFILALISVTMLILSGSTPTSAPEIPDHVVISEIQIADSEFVELYNPTNSNVDMTGWHWCYYSSTRTSWNDPYRDKEFPSGTTIASHGFYLIGLKGYPTSGGSPNSDWQPYTSSQLGNSAGTVGIFNDSPSESTRIDAVGWGGVTLKEGASADVPAAGQSIERVALFQDTEDNAVDFVVQETPSPKNSSSFYGVSTAISPEERTGMKGEVLNYEVTITNEGTEEDTYTLRASDGLGWEIALEEESLTTPAGSSATTTLKVTIPLGAEAGVENTITVTATSQTDIGVKDSDACVARVGTIYGVGLEVDQAERTTEPGTAATYTLTVKNIGNTTDSFTLAVENMNDADTVELSVDQVANLGSGATQDITLQVADAKAGAYIVRVTATSQGNPLRSAVVETRTIVIIKGDIDSNGEINTIDARIVWQFSLGLIDLTEEQKKAADVAAPFGPPYDATTITKEDAIQIARYALGLESELLAASAAGTAVAQNGSGNGLLPLLFVGIIIPGLVRMRRRWLRMFGKRSFLVLLALALAALTLTGCFGLKPEPPPPAPPPPAPPEEAPPAGTNLIIGDVSLAAGGAGVVTISVTEMPGSGLAALQVNAGGFIFDQQLIQITDIVGVGDFEVLAWVCDNAKGFCKWAAVNPLEGVVTGDILELTVEAVGTGTGKIQFVFKSDLLLGDANNQKINQLQYNLIPGEVKVE